MKETVLQHIMQKDAMLDTKYSLTNVKIGAIEIPAIKSIGLGLSIVRFMCKALDGESNIEMFPKHMSTNGPS